MRVQAHYFDGVSSQLNPVEIDVSSESVIVYLFDEQKRFDTRKVRIQEGLGSSSLSMDLPNGGRIECPGIKHREQIGLRGKSKSLRRLERGFIGLLMSVFILVGGVWFCGEVVFPKLVPVVLPNVPEAIFDQVDQLTIKSLDKQLLKPTALTSQQRDEITTYFFKLVNTLPNRPPIKVEFRAAKQFLPNAFTLSGNTIVITDDLIELLKTKEEVGAILAHELGHYELKHVKKTLVRITMASLLITLATGDISNTVGQLSTALWQLRLSREEEYEADLFGAKLLKDNQADASLLATGLEKLEEAIKKHLSKKKKEDSEEESILDQIKIFETHPDTPDRAKRIRALL